MDKRYKLEIPQQNFVLNMDKREQILNLIDDLKKEEASKNVYVKRKGKNVNVGLINQFQKHDFIPNK
jgi:hypothetical protein